MEQEKFKQKLFKYSEACLALFTNRTDKERTIWIPFWSLSISNMLKTSNVFTDETTQKLKDTILSLYVESEGGFTRYRAPFNYIHLAETYAAVSSLGMLNETQLIYSLAFKEGLLSLSKNLTKDSKFIASDLYGEEDLRGFYFIVACFHMVYIHKDKDTASDLNESTNKKEKEVLKEFIKFIEPSVAVLEKCLSFEGGFGSNVNCEAHIGYTFAACNFIVLLEDLYNFLNLDVSIFDSIYSKSEMIEKWMKEKQNEDGGLCGRVDKSSDSCYSFWAIGCTEFLKRGLKREVGLFDNGKLESYIMTCYDEKSGTFKKRPDMETDFYHTYYSLCGLSLINPDKYELKPINGLLGHCINN